MNFFESLENRQLLAVVPTGFDDQQFVSGLSRPTSMVRLPDGRWLVTEQAGKLRVIKDGKLLSTPAITITTDSISERGLLGVTIDPDFTSNGYIYIYWTVNTSTRTNAVSRWTLVGDQIKGGTGKRLMTLDPLTTAGNHNGGALHFGKDGKLYVAIGDNANPANAASLNTLHGKMLRINRDGSIPTDNPFYNSLSGNNRAIWAYGLRNPYTFGVHPNDGTIYINDVGQSSFEEINLGRAGANYGWPASEGPTSDPAFDAPIFSYNHDVGQAVTAGAFYSPQTQQFPASYRNQYFLGDYTSDWIKTLDPVTREMSDFATLVDRPVDIDIAPDGTLYYLGYAGSIRRITYSPQQVLTITDQPDDVSTEIGGTARFTVEATGASNITYQWFRGTTPIPDADQPTLTLENLTADDDDATFFVRVTADSTLIDSRIARLTVITDNTVPVPVITTPTGDTTFRHGQTIHFSGSATDAEDGILASSKLHWNIQYITGSVVRPFKEVHGSASGSFAIPTTTPYTATDVQYRITLTATDSIGASASTVISLTPQLSALNLSSTGANVPILLDGQPQSSPALIQSVEGLSRTIEAPATHVVNGVTYVFVSWSDGGARSRTITVPADDLNLIASYAPQTVPTGGGRISGVVFIDSNRNGKRDSGESAIANRRIWVDLDKDGLFDTNEPFSLSDSNGLYNITGIPTGTHRIRQDLPAGWTQIKGSYSYYFGKTTHKSNIVFTSYVK